MEATKLLQEEKAGNKGARTVAGLVNSIEMLEGAGFLVRRPFPKASFSGMRHRQVQLHPYPFMQQRRYIMTYDYV
ncbi:MAG: hypothetical protein WBV94_29095 [Blastocatellia bacterium]